MGFKIRSLFTVIGLLTCLFVTSMMAACQHYKTDVVMFGDSITAEGKWNKLFPDINIVNLGVGGDTTYNLTKRINGVYKYNPKYCFIMAGFNDIDNYIDPNETYENYIRVLKKLEQKEITPVIISTTYAASYFKSNEQFNSKIDKLNDRLKNYASENKITYIDLNRYLSKNHSLSDEYRKDHVHFNEKAYKIWRETIKDTVYGNKDKGLGN